MRKAHPFDDPLEWTIYFSNGHPFGSLRSGIWRQRTDAAKPGDRGSHRGILAAAPAREPGDYKYGVRISNARTGEQLSDDDPMLIVRR